MNKVTSMQLKFDGQSHSVDANTLVNSLIHYQNIVNEVNKQYGGGAKDISIKVNAIEKGSFVIDLSVVQSVVQQIFNSADGVEYVANVVAISGGVYALYRKLCGKPANNDGSIIINGDASINNTTINVYNQPAVREAISKTIEEADADPNVDGFSVYSGSEKTAEFKRSDFKDYIYDDFENEADIPDENIIEHDASLVIVGLNFEKGANWQFMYNGFKINIRVKDSALMTKIDEGERFGKGDSIRVRLRIVQHYNKNYGAYENKSYKIVEFISHDMPQKPLPLFE